MNTIDELKMKIFASGTKVNLLIAINVAVFLVFGLLNVGEYLITRQNHVDLFIREYLAVPTYLPKLLTRFWTPFTYMFLHAGFFHILFNMLWLYWMGRIFEDFLNSKKLVFVYIAGGLAGAFFYIASFNLFPAFADVRLTSAAVGASASVTAILVACATLVPNYSIHLLFLGAIRLKWIALIYVVIDLLSITGSNAGGYLSHLGGAIFGFVFIKALQNGNDWSKPFTQRPTRKSKLKVVSKSHVQNFKVKNTETPNQATIDAILDKISTSGYDNLTAKDKETLFKASTQHEEKEK
ncbi:rhomboid family intramembrane serine protease [Pelobium manganitolerans]|uniref:rhomboid family intramembrane serine protease n=1 Tax=Pelobium manganitolerans TaxID=1842495 RepID=UPI003FA3C4E6